MSQALMQYSFHAGELAPSLYARVDISKYKSGAALMRNMYPDYRGGASSRMGTKYVLRCKTSNGNVRLIPFQQSTNVNYALEFGEQYIRFYFNGAPVLESSVTITAMSKANPCQLTSSSSHGYAVGDWIFMTVTNPAFGHQLSGRYFIVASVPSSTTFTITDLWGNAIDSTGYATYVSGRSQRVYTISSPYLSGDIPLLKYAQNSNTLLITHNNYAPRMLTLLSATQWLLTPCSFGATVSPPTMGAPSSTLAAGSVNYAYAVTSVDSGGQESTISTIVQLNSLQDIRSVAGTNVINWSSALGAVTYNVYRAEPSYAGAVPTGAAFGFVGTSTGTSFVDSNIAPDFSQSPPTAQNPFQGQSVLTYTLTATGTYTSAPSIFVGAPSPGGQQATALALLGLTGGTVGSGGSGYVVGQKIGMKAVGDSTNTILWYVTVSTVSGSAVATFASNTNPPLGTGWGPGQGTAPTNLIDVAGGGFTINPATWGVQEIVPIAVGSGYLSAPTVTFVPAGATATAPTLFPVPPSSSNPGCVTYFQQRLVLAAPSSNPQEFNMSQTGAYFNFNVSDPVVASDAIQGTLVSFQLNNIKSMAPMSTGLVVLTDRAAWLMNGGSIGSPVTPSQIVATQHSYIGANDMPPIVINYDILYVQAKGSIVRDLTYNFYAQIYTGTDISILSSHLFYNFQLLQWAYAEEPYKIIWVVRSDGVLLSLTYLKEQEIIGWAHHDTRSFLNDGGPNELVQSVCTITESIASSLFGNTNVDAVYLIVERIINNQTVQYVERMADRLFNDKVFGGPGYAAAWCLDCAVRINNNPQSFQTIFLDHLLGKQVMMNCDGQVFTGTVSGNPPQLTSPIQCIFFTVGFQFFAQLQTLRLDTGEPTSQGKRKKISAVTVRVQDTVGLSIGKTFNSLVPMKDLVIGGLNTPGNFTVTDLVTGDARTILDPSWDTPGQYCIQQSNPWPATILGVIPEIELGDTADRVK